MATIRYGEFEWDNLKASQNLTKHGVSFEEATTVFYDPHAIDAPDLVNPTRFVIIGLAETSRVLFVVSAEQHDRIRIISARKATPSQRRNMSKTSKSRPPPETSLKRYDWTKATRGRFADRFPRDAHAVVIDPAVWPYFGSAEAVNAALRAVLTMAKTVRSRSRAKREHAT